MRQFTISEGMSNLEFDLQYLQFAPNVAVFVILLDKTHVLNLNLFSDRFGKGYIASAASTFTIVDDG